MNHKLLYQLEAMLSAHLPRLNSWQQANVALFSYGVIKAESCQQGAIARAVSCGEQVESAARRFRRWLDNEVVDLPGFFQDWSRWVVSCIGSGSIRLLVGLAWQGRSLPFAWRK